MRPAVTAFASSAAVWFAAYLLLGVHWLVRDGSPDAQMLVGSPAVEDPMFAWLARDSAAPALRVGAHSAIPAGGMRTRGVAAYCSLCMVRSEKSGAAGYRYRIPGADGYARCLRGHCWFVVGEGDRLCINEV